MTIAEQKKLAACTAIDILYERGELFSGMKIGLGTGSTAMPAVERLAEYIKSGKLTNIKAAVTSFQTGIACERLDIPCYSLNSKMLNGSLDLAIDGADEISPENYVIKGGGAALLQEKIVEYSAKKLVIIADTTKDVPTLGTRFPLPVEVISEARLTVTHQLEKLGATVTLREGVRKAGPVITDNGNMILDITWKSPVNPAEMEDVINHITGVVENGFFTKNRPEVFIAREDGSVTNRNA